MNGLPTSPGDTVSVVIPCYNGADFVHDAVRSAIEQTHAPLEVIVIDDGSSDNSAEIAAAFGPPVRVLRQPNQGESVARNRGMEEARGSWIAFLDADDLWRPRKLESQLALVDDGVVAVHTNYCYFGDREEPIDLARVPREQRYDLVRLCLLQNEHFNMSSLMVRADVETRFPTWTRYGEDLTFFLELILSGRGRVALAEQELVAVRRHANNQTVRVAAPPQWHQSMLQWLKTNEHRLTAEQLEAIRSGWIALLTDTCRDLYWQRQWPQFQAIRDYLRDFPEHAQVRELLDTRVYPPWVYSVKDRLDRWLRPASSESANT